jgi:hypothetical protein
MLKFLKGFFILVVLYHIIVTVVCYGILWGQYPELPSLIRDWLWIGFFILMLFLYRKDWKNYFSKRKYPWIALIIMMIWWIIISIGMDKSISDILIWIKYWFFYIFIFLSASFLWFVWKNKLEKIKNLKSIWYFLIWIVVLWFLRQWAKLVLPDFFMQIWYGPLNDFFFGKNPPIYYLTWYEWTLRWQWLFSWPNNYGYFLVAFLPIVLLLFKVQVKRWKDLFKSKSFLNLIWIFIWIIAILFTLSRTAILWWALVFLLLNIDWIRKNKIKTWIIIALWIAWIVALSILKWSSTLGHMYAKLNSINRVIQKPMWLGLGTAWPAIHHNGTILPENYFIQIMIDIGTIWFILWAWIRYAVILIEKKIKKSFIEKNNNDDAVYLIRKYLNIGWICLLLMWLFLHVFEDSMVNYLFFISYWIVTGYLTNFLIIRK